MQPYSYNRDLRGRVTIALHPGERALSNNRIAA